MSGAGGRRVGSPLGAPGIPSLAWRTGRGLRWLLRPFRSSGPGDQVFPGMEAAVSAGLLIGAVIAINLAWVQAYGLPALLLRGAMGMFAGGIIAVLIAARWAVPAPASVPMPDSLWDRWLDAEAVVEADPGIAFIADLPEPVPEPALIPRRASVRPRVIAPESGESMRLEDEILSFARSGARGAIRIAGRLGSGKTTALAHLAASLPRELAVSVLDEPRGAVLADAAARGVVVYAASDTAHPTHLATYDLAPWGKDEWIEYLLATGRGQCASVMTRLEAAPDRDWLQGNPELSRIVLYRMACDPTLTSIHDAMRQELAARLNNDADRRLAEEVCLAHLRNREAVLVQPDSLEAELATQCPDQALRRLVRHRPIQLLIAARRIATDLADGHPCEYLETRLPLELVQEAGTLLHAHPLAVRRLRFTLNSLRRHTHAMAASLLHASGTGWRPPPATEAVCVPNLAGAYLGRVAWHGVDLRGVELEGADLAHAQLQRAQLDAANLDRACLCQASLEGASLASATARGADLSHADLESLSATAVDLFDANLEGAILTAAFLRNARLLGANLKDARLSGADLTRANLCGADIAGADFTGAILDSAVLKGLTLFRSEFKQARFTAADLSACDLEGMDLPQAVFRKAQLENALLTGSTMPGADFRDASLRSAGLAEVDWEGACLAGADLRLATFHLGTTRSGLVQSPIACEGSRTGFYTDDFDEQDFKSPEEVRKANLCGADLRGARIDDVDFYLVDLRGAVFDCHQVEHFRRCGAILKRD